MAKCQCAVFRSTPTSKYYVCETTQTWRLTKAYIYIFSCFYCLLIFGRKFLEFFRLLFFFLLRLNQSNKSVLKYWGLNLRELIYVKKKKNPSLTANIFWTFSDLAFRVVVYCEKQCFEIQPNHRYSIHKRKNVMEFFKIILKIIKIGKCTYLRKKFYFFEPGLITSLLFEFFCMNCTVKNYIENFLVILEHNVL